MLEARGYLWFSHAQRQTLTPEPHTTEFWECGSSATPPTILGFLHQGLQSQCETPMQTWGHLAIRALPALKQPSLPDLHRESSGRSVHSAPQRSPLAKLPAAPSMKSILWKE